MVEKRIDSGGGERAFVYTADDEHFWTYHWSGSRWTLRDLDGKVLRDYRSGTGGWSVERDYVYRDGQLLAAVGGGTTYHYHLDHLGTPRLITNQNGTKLAYHVYFPYGEEASSWNQDSEVMKFTGYERDFYDASGPADDLDYHHARYYNPLLGRYLGVDPVMQIRRASSKPQLWNRYTYVVDNPLNFRDLRGEDVSIMVTFRGDGWTDDDKDEVLRNIAQFWERLEVGEVNVFDSAKFNETNPSLFNAGVASITIDAGIDGSSHAGLVAGGEYLNATDLSRGERLQAVANAATHEIFSHQFGLGPHSSADSITYSVNRGGNVVPAVAERYGTVTDFGAWRDPATRAVFVGGPVPVHASDKAQAQRQLRSRSLRPPSAGPNRWWKFW